MSRIDDAVRRILRVKIEMGLLDRPAVVDRKLFAEVGSKAHRETARQAVRESLVLLKNDNKMLPLNKKIKKLFVAGRAAHNMGFQCGGWTITWMGSSIDDPRYVPEGGTTILNAIKAAVSKDTEIQFYMDGKSGEGYDAAVVVIGETPYAEMTGDRYGLYLDEEDIETVQNAKKCGLPVVTVLISGRPMLIGDILPYSDAVIAAWLPGTEGAGVVDVLFGDYKPTGKLSFSWPRDMKQIPIHQGDKNYDPLYPYGYGLTY